MPSGVDARAVRHRELVGDDAVVAHVDEDAAFVAPVAPAVDHVGAADRGDDRPARRPAWRGRSDGSGPRRRAGR